MRNAFLVGLIPLAAISLGCSRPSPMGNSTFSVQYPGPPVSVIAHNYFNYPLITPQPVTVNPTLAMLCAGTTKVGTRAEFEAPKARYGPHANAWISIYMNQSAGRAFRDRVTPYPVGSVIVKQKTIEDYDPDWNPSGVTPPRSHNGVGGMVKRANGFDPEHGDWEYFYFEDPARIESGRIASCVNCHESAKATDYVFGTWRASRESAMYQ